MVKCRNWIAQYLKVFGTGLELILTDVVPNNVRLKLYYDDYLNGAIYRWQIEGKCNNLV